MVPNLQKSCIICGSATDLNTAMGVTLDDEPKTKVQVAICDVCADDCTPKKAREAYLKKQAQIDEVLAQARALGMDISPVTGGGLIIATQTEQPPAQVAVRTPAPQARPLPPGVSPILEGEDVVSTAVLDRPVVSVGGAAKYGNGAVQVPSHMSHDINSLADKAPAAARVGKAQMGLVEGRGGQPLMIPVLRQDGMGTTRMRVVKTGDKELQDRFKRTAGVSHTPNGPSYRHGYDPEVNQERRCAFCAGQGQLPNGNRMQTCPRCKGSGLA